MPVVVVAIGAVLLTALMALYQTPTLVEALQGETEAVAGVSELPDVSSAPPGNAAAGANKAEYVADSARAKRLRTSLENRSTRNGSPGESRAAEELGETGDRYSIPALHALAPRDPDVATSESPNEAGYVADSVRVAQLRASPVNRSFIRSGSRAPEKLDATEELAKIVSDTEVSAEAKIEAIEEVIKDLEEPDSTDEPAGIVSDPDVPEDPEIEPIEPVADAPEEPDSTEEPADIVPDPDVPEDPKIEPIEEKVYTTEDLLDALRDPSSDVYEMAADMLWDLDDASVADAV